MSHWLSRSIGVGLIVAIFYSLGVPTSTAISLPDPDTLGAEGGGTYIPGSMVTLVSGQDATTTWSLDQYDTTRWDCIDLHWKSIATNLEFGSFGGCGLSTTNDFPIVVGDAKDRGTGIMHAGAFGYRVPLGTATIKVVLDDQTILTAVPAGGVWVTVWTGSAKESYVDALSATGGLIHHCVGYCSQE